MRATPHHSGLPEPLLWVGRLGLNRIDTNSTHTHWRHRIYLARDVDLGYSGRGMVYGVWPAHGCCYIKRTSLSFSGRIPLVATDTPRAATLVQTSGPEETVNTTATSKCTQESETSAPAPAALCSLRGRSGMCRGLDAVASLPVLMPKQDRVKSVGSCGPPLSGVWFPALLGSSLPSLIGVCSKFNGLDFRSRL